MTSPTPQSPEHPGPQPSPQQGFYVDQGYPSQATGGYPTYPGYPAQGQPFVPAQRQPSDSLLTPVRPSRGTWKWVLAGVVGMFVGIVIGLMLGVVIGVVGSVSSSSTAPGSASSGASQAGPNQAGPAAPVGPLTTLGPGTYQVGTAAGDATPGQYRSPGPDGSGSCYYARLKQNDGTIGDILANDLSNGPSVFTLQPSDGYVVVKGCTFTHS